jgi:membrane-bound lytic murein transglycosylase MltF
VGSAIAQRNNGMIDKTARERQAIRDARTLFAEALTDLGLMEPFFHRSAEDIDRLIEAAVTGYIDSMQEQAARKERTGTVLDDPIPF